MFTRNPLGSLLGLSALLMSAWPFAAQAADIHVPADQPTIQAGISAAGNGDVVLIADGIYTGEGNKNITFQGKAITVRSESNDPTLCIVDCQGSEGGFNFGRGDTAASVLSGLTIRNGAPTTTGLITPGSGIFCLDGSPTVTNCILSGYSASVGGGMFIQSGNPTVSNCVFIGNNATLHGGGIYTSNNDPYHSKGTPNILNCTFTQNMSLATASVGGGAIYNDGCSPNMTNCVFTGNTALAHNGGATVGTIQVTVVHVNQPPVAYNSGFSTTTNKAISLGLPASDPDGDPLTYTIVSGPTHGKLTGTGSVRTYKPAADFNGTDTFTFKVNDGQYDSNIATVTLTVSPLNHPPKAVADKVTTQKGVAIKIDVLSNDSDPDGDPLSVQSITQPADGMAVLNADGTVTYTPTATFRGKDSFTYTISDGRGGTDTATVTITVTARPLFALRCVSKGTRRRAGNR